MRKIRRANVRFEELIPSNTGLGGTERMNDYKNSMQNSLKLGFFIQPVHPPSRSYGDVLREDREAVVL
nr:hypothetical protein [Phormidium tenue FACHB-886]